MPPRKRKTKEDQPTLEEVTDQPVKVVKSTKAQLASTAKKGKTAKEAETKPQDSKDDMFHKRRAKRLGIAEPAPNQEHKSELKEEKPSGSDAGIWINRAPTLTLWVSIVAQRQGLSKEAGLTFGKTISGILAHSKGKSIGIYEDRGKTDEEIQEKKEKEDTMGVERVDVFGMKIKALKEQDGEDVRALDSDDQPVDPGKVQSYLKRAFGTRLEDAERVLMALAESYSDPDELAKEAYNLYSEFRPQIQTGQSGWGQKGLLDLQHIKELHKK
ncbi:g4650 [Coccomyxa elongata]